MISPNPFSGDLMKKYIPGIALSIVIAAAAVVLSEYIRLGGVTLAILIGIVVRNTLPISDVFQKGIKFTEKKILTYAIALLGFTLDYRIFADLGFETLLIIALGVPFTIFLAVGLGKVFGLNADTALLLGVGNGICGSSAIAAAQGVIKTDEGNVGVSVATINLLGAIGIFLLPALCYLFPDFLEQQKGILIGNTLQAVGQVSAAGYSVSDVVGETATVVKMGRILMVTPVVMILASLKKGESGSKKLSIPKVPGYLLFFLLFSLINSLGILPHEVVTLFSKGSKYLLTIAMAGIGMSISTDVLKAGGKKSLLTGVSVWIIQIAFSLLLVTLLAS